MTTSDSLDYPRLSYAVAFLERTIRRALAESLRPFGLSLAQYTVLSVLGRRDGLSNAQLARRSYVTPQAMSEIVRYLERQQLVVREPSPEHARIHPTRLTAKGRSVLEQCDEAVDAVERAMLDQAGVADEVELIEIMMRCARSLDATT